MIDKLVMRGLICVILAGSMCGAQQPKASSLNLPQWIPYREQLEAATGAYSTVNDIAKLQKALQSDTKWIDQVTSALMKLIAQQVFAQQPMDEVAINAGNMLKDALYSEQKKVSEYTFLRSTLALKNEIATIFSPELKGVLLPIIDETLDNVINRTNIRRTEVAYVRTDNALSAQEQEWRMKRYATIVPAQQQIIGDSVTSDNALRIGIAMSGGGYRAMTLTSGYLKGLENIGVLDSSLYVSGLSGSTWFIAPWISQRLSIQAMQDHLQESIKTNHFNLLGLTKFSAADIEKLLLTVIWPKTFFNEQIGSVDLFGAILARSLFYKAAIAHTYRLSEQYSLLNEGNYPFPLYVAVSMHKEQQEKAAAYHYHWYEFNPIEMSNLDLGYTIPVWSAGRLFNQGESKNFAPEQSLGFLMGIWGSAYTVNTKDIHDQLAFTLEHETKEKSGLSVKIKIIELLEKLFSSQRISPAQLFNPWLGMTMQQKDRWLAEKERITLVDGGLYFNIAAAPYFHKNRNLDLIIVCDSSSNIEQLSKQGVPAELQKLFDYLKRYGLHYQRTPEQALEVYKTTAGNGPAIIYLNFKNDRAMLLQLVDRNDPLTDIIRENKLLAFDPSLSYTNTFNFNYTPENFSQLSGMGEVIIRAKKEAFLTILKKLFQEKMEKSKQ